MNSACAGAEDGSTELHTVAVRENKQYRNRAKASLLLKDGNRKSRKSRTRNSRRMGLSLPRRRRGCRTTQK